MTSNPAIEKAIERALIQSRERLLDVVEDHGCDCTAVPCGHWIDRTCMALRTLAEAAYSAGERDGAARIASELGRSLVQGEKGE